MGGVPDADDHWDEADADAERAAAEPWLLAYGAEPDPGQVERLATLGARPGYDLHPRCVIADGARVVADRLQVGEHTTIAAGCLIRGDVTIGAHCSLNAGAITMGRVRIGNVVRIASYAVLVGENHGTDDLALPIAAQPMTSMGVVVEDDVWIGANVTVVDGVTIGAHAVIAAGAVVTRDVAPWTVVAGVPARPIRDRREGPSARRSGRAAGPTGGPRRRDALARFDATVADQWPAALARCEIDHKGTRTYADAPGAAWAPRPLNDAIEIAGAFGATPPVAPPAELIARIQALQDPVTGMFGDPRLTPPEDPLAPTHQEWDMYGVLSCGYALEVLGAAPAHPVHAVEACTAERLEGLLDRLDWGWLAWTSGSWVDGFATAAYLNRRHHGSTQTHPMLWGWLATHVHRASGMWGTHLDPAGELDVGWLMAVNGYYRMTRGAHAQWGVPLPHPEAAIDTVLAHGRRWDWFAATERNACNVLDVIHPLWLLGRQVPYRAPEIREVAARILTEACDDWVDGAGMPWEVGRDQPGLQGTEMWLAIVHLAADVLGEADGLSWTPRGVHRLAPATSLD